MSTFDYVAYVNAPGNEDVKAAVEAGEISAQDHWANFGSVEGRSMPLQGGDQSIAIGAAPAPSPNMSTGTAPGTVVGDPTDPVGGGGPPVDTSAPTYNPDTGNYENPPAGIADGGTGVVSPRDITAAWTAEDVENFRNNSMWGSSSVFRNPYHYVDPWTGRNTILENIQSGAIPFNENFYLAQYPDVARAIASGQIGSAAEHYANYGYKEARAVDPLQTDPFANLTQTISQQAAGVDPVAQSALNMGIQPNWTSSGYGSASGGGGGGGGGSFWDMVYGGQGGYPGNQGTLYGGGGNTYVQMPGAGLNYGSGATSMYGANQNFQTLTGGGAQAGGAHYGGSGMGLPAPAPGVGGAVGAPTPDMAQVVPGQASGPNQMNVADWSGNVASRPANFFNTDDPRTPGIDESMFMAGRTNLANPFVPGTHINPNNTAYQNLQSVIQSENVQAANTAAQAAQGYLPTSVIALMNQHYTQAAQGQVSNQAQVNLSIGEALFTPGVAAQQDLDAVDARATVRGQLELLQADWTDPATGEQRIPLYAQAQAREVSKIAAFKGMTGSAATAAMATALQEASIDMAVRDASFYQTLTLENLSNRQEMAITNANILANMELQNADNRLAAAIHNSQQFLQMDLANLNNQQQANIIDAQARIQSILDYGKEANVASRFGAEQENNMQQFYDELNSNINQFNASLGQNNNQFNANMRNNREQFYANMQYQIDQSNANWVRNVVLAEDQQLFEANRTDVQNMVNIGNEVLNEIWDRSDSLLDYAWRAAQNTQDRDLQMVLQNLRSADASRLAEQERNAGYLEAIGGAFFNAGGGDWIGDTVSAIFGGIF